VSNVVFVAGAARSGSSLLGEILGAQRGVLNGGELSLFWRNAARGNSCACGSPLRSCDLWGSALDRVGRELDLQAGSYVDLAQTRSALAHTTHPQRLSQMRRQPSAWSTAEARLITATSLLYEVALELSDAEVLVDTSKTLPALLFHELTPQRQVTVIHLVRDPRAVAASTIRSIDSSRGNADSLPPGGGLSTAIGRWVWANATASIGARRASTRVRIHYEDLVQAPAELTRDVCDRAGIHFDPATVTGDRLLREGQSHAAVGNPRRGEGAVRLVLDDRWRSELSPARALFVRAITWPIDAALKRANGEWSQPLR